MAQRDTSELLKIFITNYNCSPAHAISMLETWDNFSWMQSEYLCILENLCNQRNSMVSGDIRDKIKKLEELEATVVDDIKLNKIRKDLKCEREQLKNIEINGYDFLSNCQSLVHFITQYRDRCHDRNIKMEKDIKQTIDKYVSSVGQSSRKLFLQGTPVEFCHSVTTNGINCRKIDVEDNTDNNKLFISFRI